MNCVKHIDKEASGVCVYCGKFFCEECLVEVEGKNYCKSCVGKAFAEQKEMSKSPQTININNVSNSNSNPNINTIANANTNTFPANNPMISRKSRLVSFVLCFILGYLGIHRFYVGKIGTGIIYFLTAGLFGFGMIFDLIMILVGSFKDNHGKSIKNW